MKLFDCNCSYGVGSRPPFRYARSAAELLGEMDYGGIDQALVYHTGQRFSSPLLYNRQLIDDLPGYPRLLPSWTILPAQTEEQAAPANFLNAMKVHGVKALRAFPEEHRYRLDSLTYGNLLTALAEKKVPLFVKANILVIADLLKAFPQLTVVAMNQGPHSFERYLRPLVETYPNFHVETSCYIVEGLIEAFCERYGAERLLFGTGFPDNCSGGALLRLLHAEINDANKQAIAFENLDRLLKDVIL